MTDLRIADAPELTAAEINDSLKVPTGGYGNYSITMITIRDWLLNYKMFATQSYVDGKVSVVNTSLNNHTARFDNPHQVTKTQVGLGNVDNTSDINKPVSAATQTALANLNTSLTSVISVKANTADVDTQLALKANKTDVYTKSETYKKQESNDLVNNSISTALTPVNASLELAKRGIANRYDSSLTYNSGESVILTNGDIVKSTISGNTNDPNVNMIGWVKTNSASQIFDASGKTQQEINDLLKSAVYNSFNKIGASTENPTLTTLQDVVKFGDYYYFYMGTLPHVVSEVTPDANYKCVGMLNGYPLNHIKNWGIVGDGTDQATKFQFTLENAPVDNLVSDGEVIAISKVDITTDKAIKILGFSNLRFKPYFTEPEVTKDYLFKINYSETEWENITIDNPDSGKFLTRIFNITESIRHKFTRIMISCPDYRIGTVFDMGLVKESGFTDLRIDLDTTTKQGTIFKSQSCVNNWITGGMYGFGQYFIDATPTPYDSVVYKSEGWLISNSIAVFFKNPLSVKSITALQVTNCIFDFCIEKFFEFTNGSHSMISNCWFANDTTSSTTVQPAIVAGAVYDGLTLTNNTFVNNNGNNATPLFSMNPIAKNNSFINLNRVQGFTKGIILNCEYGNNTFTDKDESVQSTVNTTWKMEGLLSEFINKNAFVENSQYYALSFRNKTAESAIVFETGNFSDLTRMRFYTQVGAALKEAMYLHNGEVGMPNLPTSVADAEIGGLYAGADNVVKIRRT